MSDKDDDFLDHGGEDFSPDSDDFEIPEDPHNDFLNDDESDFELTEEDVVDESGDDAIDLDEFDQEDDSADPVGDDPSDEYEVDDEAEIEGESQGDATLGWKAWAGLALAAVMSAGGIYTYASSMLGDDPQTQQASQQLPTPPPAPAPESNQQTEQAGQSVAPPAPQPQANQGRENAPVAVSPFPESDQGANQVAENQSAPTPPPAPSNGSVQANSGNNNGSQPPTPTPNEGGGNNASGPANRPFTVDETESEQEFSANGRPSNSGSAITPPDPRNQPDREPEYMRALQEQRQAFKALMGATQNNGKQIESVRKELDNYQMTTQESVADLDTRVDRLESLIQEGGDVKRQSEPSKTDTADTKAATDDAKAVADAGQTTPRSPAEIKGLQRTLREFGYRPGPIDGILGEQTRWGIKRLQEEHGLKVNGWLNQETLAALGDPKKFSGTYDDTHASKDNETRTARGDHSNDRPQEAAHALGEQWFVRGVTPTKAVVYRPDGLSFVAKVGTEIPGMGQVTQLDPAKLHVVTVNGVITKR